MDETSSCVLLTNNSQTLRSTCIDSLLIMFTAIYVRGRITLYTYYRWILSPTVMDYSSNDDQISTEISIVLLFHRLSLFSSCRAPGSMRRVCFVVCEFGSSWFHPGKINTRLHRVRIENRCTRRFPFRKRIRMGTGMVFVVAFSIKGCGAVSPKGRGAVPPSRFRGVLLVNILRPRQVQRCSSSGCGSWS